MRGRFSKNFLAGFTLIELLVVIAIIGILASVVLASLNNARRSSRDTRRLLDLKEIKLAMSDFFDSNRRYPDNTEGLLVLESAVCGGRICLRYVGRDPVDVTIYPYYQCDNTMYHLGASLENTGTIALNDDLDSVPSGCAASSISSADSTGCGGEANRYCYDTVP